jgi:hypothetical protein
MTRLRVVILLITLVVLVVFGTFGVYYARGYRFDFKSLKFTPRGLLVVDSDPNGAQIWVNGELTTATNATLRLSPAVYDIEVKKEGYLAWKKRLTIEKEVVTKVDVILFPTAPSLSAITFSGAANPVASPDSNKIAYSVPPNKEDIQKGGLWVIETSALPIGFSKDPKRITDGDLTQATWQWSPNSREILLTTKTSIFLLDATSFTPQDQRVNVASQKETILSDWQEEKDKKLSAQLSKLPDEIESIFARKAADIFFSPDETKILFTASGSATIPEGITKALPGASTQKQTRTTKSGQKYIYDIKEDRNFEVASGNQPAYWLPTSNHIILPESDKIVIADYDGTNPQIVYSGSYVAPFAFPYTNASQLLILTTLGSTGPANLYTLSLK